MAGTPEKFHIPSADRAAAAVYAVAIGDHLGLPLSNLRQIRAAVEASELTGDTTFDPILCFVEALCRDRRLGALPTAEELNSLDPIVAAFAAVAGVIQPLRT